MIDKIVFILLFGIRGAVHAIPFFLVSVLFISGVLKPSAGASSLEMLSTYISNGITLLGLGLFLASLVVWI
jgi:hypothetical protein